MKNEHLNLFHLKSENYDKEYTLQGLVVKKILRPKISEIIFGCPECSAQIKIPQNDEALEYPKVCECGRRKSFDIINRIMIDSGIITLVQMNKSEIQKIDIVLKDDEYTKPEIWDSIKIGSSVVISGKLDFLLDKKKSIIPKFILHKIESIGDVISMGEKEGILEEYFGDHISIKIDKKFIEDMYDRGLITEDLPEIIDRLITKNKIIPIKQNELMIPILDKYLSEEMV